MEPYDEKSNTQEKIQKVRLFFLIAGDMFIVNSSVGYQRSIFLDQYISES
jgi:hypothetical protein